MSDKHELPIELSWSDGKIILRDGPIWTFLSPESAARLADCLDTVIGCYHEGVQVKLELEK